MKRLNYNIYLNITDSDFLKIEERLINIENRIKGILKNKGWNIITPVSKNDGLIVGFRIHRNGFYGTFGIAFEDKSKQITFECIVSKSFDEVNIRYHLKKIIAENRPLEDIENNFETYLYEALELYESWTREDIVKLGSKID